MWFDTWLLQTAAGLANGVIYATLALALVMIHRTTHHINFAQGEMATLSAFLAWSLMQAGWSFPVAFVFTLTASLVLGVAVQRIFLRPIEGAPVLTQVMVFVGLLMVIHAFMSWQWGHTLKTLPSPFPAQGLPGLPWWTGHELGAMAMTAVIMGLVHVFFRYTTWGLAMRAAAEHPESARWLGIHVSWMLAWGWGLAAMVGAVAGILIAPVLYLEPNMMMGVLLYAFAAAVLGGLDSPLGAVLGGLVVGVLDHWIGAFVVGHELKQPMALLLIVLVLWLRPQGLLGRASGARA
ncbi:MAG: hypothetical protein RL307_525 [Pseudomonadota bacterium]|jgi:branched-chain amino acid transport system permease protein